MKVFELKENVEKLSKNPMVAILLNMVEFYRGKTYGLPDYKKLNRLHDQSKRFSVTSSNQIENIVITKSRTEGILSGRFPPETDEEKQILGYNKALDLVFSSYKKEPLSEKFIKRLHILEWSEVNPVYGGYYKDSQNYVRETTSSGGGRTVFIPLSVDETPQAMGNLIYQFNMCLSDPNVNRLLLSIVFIQDFLCIHPFLDGNGRVSRLLTTFLLMKFGYTLDMYYSLSYVILSRLSDYYSSLEKSSIGWAEGENDYGSFGVFMLSCLYEGYKKLDYIFSLARVKMPLRWKIETIVQESLTPVTKADVEEILFNNTRDSIEEALGALVKEGRIELVQKGRYALYKSLY